MENESGALTRIETPTQSPPTVLTPSNWELAQRMATALSRSNIIPQTFQNNLPNCLIALEMSQRMGIPAMMVMQNLYVVHGKPAWSSQFVIAAINSTGRFSPLRFQMDGEGEKRICTAWAVELATKERLEGPPVSIDMAKKEGWYGKNGSKWQTMPELMLRYRAATFFGRLYAPEILMGMREEGEIIDVEAATPSPIAAPVGLPAPAPAENVETPKKTPRGKKDKQAAPAEEPPAPSTGPAAEIEAKLKEAGFTLERFIEVAIQEKFADPPIDKISDIPEAALKVMLKNWDATVAELKPAERGPMD